MAGMAAQQAKAAGRVAMVERDGARYTMGTVTSVGDAVRPAACPPPNPAHSGAVLAAVGWGYGLIASRVIALCTMPASLLPDVVTIGPAAPILLGAASPTPATLGPVSLALRREPGTGVSGGTRAETGIGGDRNPASNVLELAPRPPPPAWDSDRRRRPLALLVAELVAAIGGLGGAVAISRWPMRAIG